MGLARFVVALPFSVGALLGGFTVEPRAHAAPASVGAIAAKMRVTPPPARRRNLIQDTARPYARARRALARGEPAKALIALKEPHGNLFEDREALLRADAMLALGQIAQAQKNYALALSEAVVGSVAVAAVRGLATVHSQQGHLTRARNHLDALLEQRRGSSPRILLAKAKLLARAKDYRAAHALAVRVAHEHPSRPEAQGAQALAERMVELGVKAAPPSPTLRLTRARGLVEAGRLEDAARVLDTLDPRDPKVRLVRARQLERAGEETRAEAILEALGGPKAPDGVAAEALERLARNKLRADDNEAALALYDRLRKRAPGTRQARRAEYLGGWIHYDAGRYAAATQRMLQYAKRHPKARDRDEALWFAGWSSYLGKAYGDARAAFERILEDHEKSSLGPHARYWIGRIAQRQGRVGEAKAAYRKVIEDAPLSYDAVWARRRLRALGETHPLLKPPPELGQSASLESALQALGPGRPITVDRAILLHQSGCTEEAVEELESSSRALRSRKDPEIRAHVFDLLHQLGAHHLAFRMAMGFTGSGKALAEGEAIAWRAWRQAYPRAFENEVDRAREAHDVPPEMVWAVMRTESHYRPRVRSRVGARGLMQLMPSTARHIGRVAEGGRAHAARYITPESNIWLGTWYLGELIERYGGQVVAAVGAYNGGPTAMDRWLADFDGMPLDEFIERIPYRQTRHYVRRVVETWAVYKQLYDGHEPKLPETIKEIVSPTAKATF